MKTDVKVVIRFFICSMFLFLGVLFLIANTEVLHPELRYFQLTVSMIFIYLGIRLMPIEIPWDFKTTIVLEKFELIVIGGILALFVFSLIDRLLM